MNTNLLNYAVADADLSHIAGGAGYGSYSSSFYESYYSSTTQASASQNNTALINQVGPQFQNGVDRYHPYSYGGGHSSSSLSTSFSQSNQNGFENYSAAPAFGFGAI